MNNNKDNTDIDDYTDNYDKCLKNVYQSSLLMMLIIYLYSLKEGIDIAMPLFHIMTFAMITSKVLKRKFINKIIDFYLKIKTSIENQ